MAVAAGSGAAAVGASAAGGSTAAGPLLQPASAAPTISRSAQKKDNAVVHEILV